MTYDLVVIVDTCEENDTIFVGDQYMGNDYENSCKGGEDCQDRRHLCKISKDNDHQRIREIIKDARYFCKKCGRSAREAEHLCKPLEI